MKKSQITIPVAYIKIIPSTSALDALRDAYERDDPKHPDYAENLLAKLPGKDSTIKP